MTDKIDPYDVLSVLVPGTLLTAFVPVCFPQILSAASVKFPDAFATLVLTALAVFVGQANQALGSAIQPALVRSWGGSSSVKALTVGIEGYVTERTALRIRGKLAASLAGETDEKTLFSYAMECAREGVNPRVERFNSLYGYHRNLISMLVICALLVGSSMHWGAARTWPFGWFTLLLAALMLGLAWRRARQRDIYYVREVIVTAETVLEKRLAASMPTR